MGCRGSGTTVEAPAFRPGIQACEAAAFRPGALVQSTTPQLAEKLVSFEGAQLQLCRKNRK